MVYITMKRSREEGDQFDNLTMANCLMLLSQSLVSDDSTTTTTQYSSSPNRVFECKTCNRQFPSFQALGGHRASHKKPRFMINDHNQQTVMMKDQSSSPVKTKTHECSICGLEFAIGQALGGHMRRHRAAAVNNNNNNNNNNNSNSNNSSSGMNNIENLLQKKPLNLLPLKQSSTNSSRRVVCLDLNLTPLENDLEFFDQKFGKKVVAPMMLLDCFL